LFFHFRLAESGEPVFFRPMVRLFVPIFFALAVASRAAEPRPLVFCSYNLENYTDAKPPSETSRFGLKAKPEKEIGVLVKIVTEISPDVLGVCEMGSPERLAEFRARLAKAGIELPHTEFVAAADEDRHLALLSRFPIVATPEPT
jgi:hypothetical protein